MSNSLRLSIISSALGALSPVVLAGGLIVPAYTYPSHGGAYGDDWYQYAAAATYLKAHGGRDSNQLICIGNVDSGPGSAVDPNYTSAFKAVRAAGGKVVGYVDTNNGKNSLASVESEINTWISSYGKELDGIFLDNWRGYLTGNIPGSNPAMSYSSYYENLQSFIKATKKLALCLGNPGTTFTSASAAKLADILCIHEDYYSKGLGWTVPTWVNQAGCAQACAIYHDMPLKDQTAEANVIRDTLLTKKLQWVFVSDDTIAHDGGYSLLPGALSGYAPDGQWNPYWGNEQYTAGAGTP